MTTTTIRVRVHRPLRFTDLFDPIRLVRWFLLLCWWSAIGVIFVTLWLWRVALELTAP